MRKTVFVLIIALTLALPVFGACAKPEAPQPQSVPSAQDIPAAFKKIPPGTLLLGSSAADTSAYAFAVGLVNGISKASGVPAFVTPGNTSVARATLLKNYNVMFSLATALEVQYGLTGTVDFNGWDPQRFRVVWVGHTFEQGIGVRKNSGIKTPFDLKGKKLADYKGYPMVQQYMDAILAYGNISKNDVTWVPVSGTGSGMQGVLDGSVDAAMFTIGNQYAANLAASVHGLGWVDMPASDKDGWARFNKVIPAFFPWTVTKGDGITADKPAHIWGWNQHVWAYDWTPDDLVYWFVKNIAEDYNSFKDSHNELKQWTIDKATDPKALFAPYHPAAIKYFKEKGKWSAEDEAIQKAALEKYEAFQKKK